MMQLFSVKMLYD